MDITAIIQIKLLVIFIKIVNAAAIARSAHGLVIGIIDAKVVTIATLRSRRANWGAGGAD